MIEAKNNVMTDLEKERLTNYINDMTQEELQVLVRLLDADLMLEEIARREKLAEVKFNAISGLLKIT